MDDNFEDDFSPIISNENKLNKSVDNMESDEDATEQPEVFEDDSEDDLSPSSAPRIIPINNDYSDDDLNQIEYEDEDEKKPFNVKKLVIWCLILFILIAGSAVVYNTDSGFIGAYKKNFVTNLNAIDKYFGISDTFGQFFDDKNYSDDEIKQRSENKAMGTTYDNESRLIPFDSASSAQYGKWDKYVVIGKSNYIAMYDKSGNVKWEAVTTVVNPILAIEGDYILLAEKGGTKICLYNKSKQLYTVDAENEIQNAEVSSNGDVVVVTKKEYYKGAIEVFNKKRERVFCWNSGSDNIICADISPSGRRVGVGFLNTDENARSSVQLFDINKTESYKTIEIPDSVVFKLSYSGETLNVICDNRISGLSINGKILWDTQYKDGELVAYSIDDTGNKAILSEENNVPIIKLLNKSGASKNAFSIDELPDYVGISDNYIIYNNTRMVCFGKPNHFKKYAAAMDIYKLLIIDSGTYLIVYNNSIEFVKA